MTTKLAGHKITGILGLTLEAQSALAIGQPVHITGDFAVDKADGTKPIVGYVSVANVRRGTYNANPALNQAGLYPIANVPGDVTVEARGLSVVTVTAGGAITAGNRVVVGAGGAYLDGGATGALPANTALFGVALMGAANGAKLDVLVTAGA